MSSGSNRFGTRMLNTEEEYLRRILRNIEAFAAAMSDPFTASEIVYDDSTSMIGGTNVQDVIELLDVSVDQLILDVTDINSRLDTGFERKKAVINYVDNTAVPPTEVDGDRYILDFTGASNAAWDGAAAGDIVQFNGTSGLWESFTPSEGMVAYSDSEDADRLYVDDGSPDWELRTSTAATTYVVADQTAANALTGLLVGDSVLIQSGPFGDPIIQIVTAITDGAYTTSTLETLSNPFWQIPVIDQVDFTTSEPGSPSIGDRYINTATGNSSGTTQTMTTQYIYEWNGTDWTEIIPQDGYATYDQSADAIYTFDGTTWATVSTHTQNTDTGTTSTTFDINSGGNTAQLQTDLLTGNQTYDFPDMSGTLGLDYELVEVIHIGKHGSDTNDGKSFQAAVLTLSAAQTISDAIAVPGNQIVWWIVDGGEYDLDFELELSNSVSLQAPDATINNITGGQISIAGVGRMNLYEYKRDTAEARIEITGDGSPIIRIGKWDTRATVDQFFITGGSGQRIYMHVDRLQSGVTATGSLFKITNDVELHLTWNRMSMTGNSVATSQAIFDVVDGCVFANGNYVSSAKGAGVGNISLAKVASGQAAHIVATCIEVDKLYENEGTLTINCSNINSTNPGTGTGTTEINANLSDIVAGGGDLLSTNNLSDVANQQTSLNNITNVAAATDEYVLTKDTATGDAIWKTSSSTSIGNYTHTQAVSSTVWNINHSLNRYVSATTYDNAGNEIIGALFRVDANNITITFNTAQVGVAYII